MTLPKNAALFTLLAAACLTCARAETVVKDAWVRATVAQQTTTALFAQISSSAGGHVVAVASPVAGRVEMHTMAMQGEVMRMRPVPSLDLPAGQTLALTPGGYHVMLRELKQALKVGDTVPVSFVVEGPDGRRETVEAQAIVRPLGSMGP